MVSIFQIFLKKGIYPQEFLKILDLFYLLGVLKNIKAIIYVIESFAKLQAMSADNKDLKLVLIKVEGTYQRKNRRTNQEIEHETKRSVS